MGGSLLVDLINRAAGSVQEQERIREVNQGALLKQIEALSQSGSPALDDPSWDKNLKNVGLDPKTILPSYRNIGLQNRGAYQFQAGLQDTLRNYLAAPPTDPVTGQMSDIGKEIPLTADPETSALTNPANRFGGILSPPSTPEIATRIPEIAPLLELLFDPKSAGDPASANGASLGTKFATIAREFEIDPATATPEQVGFVNEVSRLRRISDEIDIATGTKRAGFDVEQEYADAGLATPGAPTSMTRVQKQAFDKGQGSGLARAQTGESAIKAKAGAAKMSVAFKNLAQLGGRIGKGAEEGIPGRIVQKGKQALGMAAGAADINRYHKLRKRMGAVLATAEQGSRPSDFDVDTFIESIPAPDLPLRTQIEVMRDNYLTLYGATQAEMVARGLDPESIDLPAPDEIPLWYGAIKVLPDGSYILP